MQSEPAFETVNSVKPSRLSFDPSPRREEKTGDGLNEAQAIERFKRMSRLAF